MPVPGSYIIVLSTTIYSEEYYTYSKCGIFFHRLLVAFETTRFGRLLQEGLRLEHIETPQVTYPTMSTQPNISRTTTSLRFAKDVPKHLWRRYCNLQPWGKLFIWCAAAFYIGLATLFIVITPDRIFQWLYDFSQRVSHLRLGWLLLGGIIGLPVCGSRQGEVLTHLIQSSSASLL
jgi:hypothetical protein